MEKLVIGNLYRPPRDKKSYITFADEFETILTKLDRLNCEIVLAGDYNADLLKLTDHTEKGFIPKHLYDTMTSHSFLPTVSLPTHIQTASTLIDNFYCKTTPSFDQIHTGVCTKEISDHQPYFICMPSLPMKKRTPKMIEIKAKLTDTAINNIILMLPIFNHKAAEQ